jgi:hypothetical protein
MFYKVLKFYTVVVLKNTMILYVKEAIHFFIYYYYIGKYDGVLRSQIIYL